LVVTMTGMSSPPELTRLQYMAEVAKDWVVSAFAAAADGDFVLAPHRFELDGSTVRRRELPRRSSEATNPLGIPARPSRPVAWARSEMLVVLHDAPAGAEAYEQEIIEILVVDDDVVLAEAAHVVRIPGVPPCLGSFWSVA
jgi:hypothetical protein